MSTTTISQTTTMSDAFAVESDHHGIFSFKSVYEAYITCRKRKRNTINALRFEVNLLKNLFDLIRSLSSGSYQPSRSVCFVTHTPKMREVFAADFSDRVIHHLLVPKLEKIFEPKFIYDSHACRKGKGIHAAAMRLKSFMNCVTLGGRIPAWFIQLDIKSFFMSIDKEILLKIIERHVKDETVMELTRKIINYNNTLNYIYKGNPELLKKIPPHKTLFHTPANKGLPIGNLTSQFFANVYLNELDQYVKHTLKAKYYLRYVDDFILLDRRKERLLEMKDKIEDFLARKLVLSLKSKFFLKRVSDGADFLGYIIRHNYILVRNRVAGNLKSRLKWFSKRMIVEGKIGSKKYCIIHLRGEMIAKLRQVLASYLGHFKHANAHNLTKSLFEKYPYLKHIFTLDESDRLVPQYEPPFYPPNLRSQYKWFIERYKDYCLFFQIGRFCEFYGKEAEKFAPLFRMKMMKETRGMGKQCGFPVRMLKNFKKKALFAGQPYIVIAESGYYPPGLKRRVITEIKKG
ncbi:MAG: hypothetical protein HZA00_08285 [Nitrospinae bacterium]|nr:hypothetical protein [Nitrospinota bacterium]